MKQCSKCAIVKPSSEYHVRRASQDGLAYKCKSCVNADSETWRQKHPDAHIKWYADNREHKSEYFKRYRTENQARLKANFAAWAKANPHKVNALIAKRRATLARAVPRWADATAIERVYEQAEALSERMGRRFNVDHVVPLQGRTVCGLHCEANLQLLVTAENLRKHNRWWPDMPDMPDILA